MEKTQKFHCENCGHEWSSNDYNIESPEREGFYAQGLYCPKCESRDISGI